MKDSIGQLIDAQIKGLLDKAAMRPGENDPAGMAGFGSVLLAAQMSILREQQKFEQMDRGDEGKEE